MLISELLLMKRFNSRFTFAVNPAKSSANTDTLLLLRPVPRLPQFFLVEDRGGRSVMAGVITALKNAFWKLILDSDAVMSRARTTSEFFSNNRNSINFFSAMPSMLGYWSRNASNIFSFRQLEPRD